MKNKLQSPVVLLCYRFIMKPLIVWEPDPDGGLGAMHTPSDKVVIPPVSPSALFRAAKMSMELFWRRKKKALLAASVSCYLAAGEVIFRLWSLRNHRCVLSDVTSGSFHQLAASSSFFFFFPPFSPVFISFIRLRLGPAAAAWALLIYLGWTSSLQACVMAWLFFT